MRRYDVFGNGRTAVKVSMGRFNQLSRSDMTRRFHPFTSSINNALRNWDDTSTAPGTRAPTTTSRTATLPTSRSMASAGSSPTRTSGSSSRTATIFEDSIIKDGRDYLWDFATEVQHEVTRGLSVSFGYNKNWDGAWQVTENTLYGAEGFDEFCVTVPTDARLPNSGQEQCGYYDVKPALFGRGQLRVTDSSEFGTQQRYWDGFTFGANGRLPKGIVVGGGLDTGRQVDDHCYTVDMPNQPAGLTGAQLNGGPFCRNVVEWMDNLDFRLRGSIPLPKGFNTSFIYRNTPGAVLNSTLSVSTASIAAGQVKFKDPTRTTMNTAQTIWLFAPNQEFGDRFTQLDIAVNKTFNVGWGRLTTSLDLYNALNSSSVQSVITAYSAARWLRPAQFLDARLIRFTSSIAF